MKKSVVLLLLMFCAMIVAQAQQVTKHDKLNSLSTEYFQAFEEGKLSLEDLHSLAFRNGEPVMISGKQELYEAMINMYI